MLRLMTDPRCGKVSRANNQDGHCTRCHCTFVGEEAFARHQRVVEGGHTVCLDPAFATVKTSGQPMYVQRPRPHTSDGYAWALNPSPGRAAARVRHIADKQQGTGRPDHPSPLTAGAD